MAGVPPPAGSSTPVSGGRVVRHVEYYTMHAAGCEFACVSAAQLRPDPDRLHEPHACMFASRIHFISAAKASRMCTTRRLHIPPALMATTMARAWRQSSSHKGTTKSSCYVRKPDNTQAYDRRRG